VELLGQSAQRFEAAVLCFVLMGNHFHLVGQTHRPNLRRWMHWLLVSYTVYFNRRHQTGGHLFQGRYKSFLVQEGDYLLGLSRYVHLNPVRGAVLGRGNPGERQKRLRAYRWSSYRGYAGVGAQFPFVEEGMVLGELSGARAGRKPRYRRFVEEGLVREVANPFEAVQWQAVLGDEFFGQRVRDRLGGLKKEGREMTAVRKARVTQRTEQILRKVSGKYGVEPERLLQRGERGLRARNVAMWMVWETGSKSLREIGELFGGLDYAAVAQRIRRIRLLHDEQAASRLIREMSNV
jgi:hypothetical protein